MNKLRFSVLASSALFLVLAGCGGPSLPSTAQVKNLTRPGASDFVVGEKFEVVVTGTPDQVVMCAASQNSSPPAKGTFGRTDKNGRFSLTGAITQIHVGEWSEQWQVGGVKAAPFRFTVKPAQAQ